MLSRRKVLQLGALTLGADAWTGCRDPQSEVSPEALALAKAMRAGLTSAWGAPISLPFRLYIPRDYQPRRRFPLVLFLHSAAARGTDNVSHLTQDVAEWTTRAQRIEPAFILVPQCPPKWQWVRAVRGGAPWRNYDQSLVPENVVGGLVEKTLRDITGEYSIDLNRRYITGASMGGGATWDAITRHPGVFAAAIPCTGVNDPSRAKRISDLPIWAFHGAKDPASPVTNTRAMVTALRQLGSTVRYTEYPDVAHNCWNRAYATDELYAWVFAQRLGQRDPLSDSPLL